MIRVEAGDLASLICLLKLRVCMLLWADLSAGPTLSLGAPARQVNVRRHLDHASAIGLADFHAQPRLLTDKRLAQFYNVLTIDCRHILQAISIFETDRCRITHSQNRM